VSSLGIGAESREIGVRRAVSGIGVASAGAGTNPFIQAAKPSRRKVPRLGAHPGSAQSTAALSLS